MSYFTKKAKISLFELEQSLKSACCLNEYFCKNPVQYVIGAIPGNF